MTRYPYPAAEISKNFRFNGLLDVLLYRFGNTGSDALERAVVTPIRTNERSYDPVQAPRAIHRVLVVDDSRSQRKVLSASLLRHGFSVVDVGSGEEAIAIARGDPPDLVLSDWMMPGIDGLELCRQIRALPNARYIYFILLTSKSEKGAVAQGLDVGADDFLPKPVNSEELYARINAGGRILKMERELNEKNRLVSSTLKKISALYDALDRDLVEARKMQQSLVRERFRDFGAATVSLLLKPSGHVGGDLVGFFRAGPGLLAAYSIDVSGHGIASALLTARLAGYLSDGAPEHNIALTRDMDGAFVARPPQEVATLLNILVHEELQSDLYFTIALAYLDQATGRVEITQCGHPNPAIVGADGSVRYVGRPGLPVGLIEGAEYEQWQIQLAPGERLLLYSDGFTECRGRDGEMLNEDGFARIISQNAELDQADLLEALVWDLDQFCGSPDFSDDLSCLVLHYLGSEAGNQPK